jgi:hypothetical protein
LLWDSLMPPDKLSVDELAQQLDSDLQTFQLIKNTCYFNERNPIPKSSTLHLAWEYAKDPHLHGKFQQMLCMTPQSFQVCYYCSSELT